MIDSKTQIRWEGLNAIIMVVLCTLVFAILGWWWAALTGLVVTGLVLNFFRDPERVVPDETGVVVAPADGKIIKIEHMRDPFSGESRQTICVFMNVFNVHVNRMPVSGTIKGIKYFPGKFINASFDKASTDNERCAWQISDENGDEWTMVQIAGLVARRIVPLAEKGDQLSMGERYGLIKFGSRVDLYMPKGYDLVVDKGDKAFAGQTVLAKRIRGLRSN
ncbi:phosphatidylserine decarboxylase family protein [Desulfonatronovibrio magnus]|uniref:phosphatidylserine decarboxylase family protein n=1 Tax=Desulfonatronovibrio magnus TaxID=698827 RepID=UPI0005EB5B5D|nr:phosphatidylserine decarboxylase family protein [Desulfonatronovibrio magnus]